MNLIPRQKICPSHGCLFVLDLMLLVREEPLAVHEQPAVHRLGDNLKGKQEKKNKKKN